MTTRYRDQRRKALSVSESLAGFSVVVVPDLSEIGVQRDRIREVCDLLERRVRVQGTAQKFRGVLDIGFPATKQIERLRDTVNKVKVLKEKVNDVHDAVTSLDCETSRVAGELAEAEAEVKRLLGDRGVCPTCNTVHGGEVHA